MPFGFANLTPSAYVTNFCPECRAKQSTNDVTVCEFCSTQILPSDPGVAELEPPPPQPVFEEVVEIEKPMPEEIAKEVEDHVEKPTPTDMFAIRSVSVTLNKDGSTKLWYRDGQPSGQYRPFYFDDDEKVPP